MAQKLDISKNQVVFEKVKNVLFCKLLTLQNVVYVFCFCWLLQNQAKLPRFVTGNLLGQLFLKGLLKYLVSSIFSSSFVFRDSEKECQKRVLNKKHLFVLFLFSVVLFCFSSFWFCFLFVRILCWFCLQQGPFSLQFPRLWLPSKNPPSKSFFGLFFCFSLPFPKSIFVFLQLPLSRKPSCLMFIFASFLLFFTFLHFCFVLSKQLPQTSPFFKPKLLIFCSVDLLFYLACFLFGPLNQPLFGPA